LTFYIIVGDGQKLALESDKMKINNILQVVNKHAKKLEEIEQAKSW
jgi:large subunit ribosomal protein L53